MAAAISVVSLHGDAFGVLPFGALDPDGIVFVQGRLYGAFAAGVQELTFGVDKDTRGLRLPNHDAANVRSTCAVSFGLSTAAEAFCNLYVIDSEIHVLSAMRAHRSNCGTDLMRSAGGIRQVVRLHSRHGSRGHAASVDRTSRRGEDDLCPA